VEKPSAVISHHVPQAESVLVIEGQSLKDKSIDLEPRYSTKDIPGRCIKCLAEQKLDTCLRELLRSEDENTERYQSYEALLAFLQSPESKKLREDSERYLAEGKQVTVKIRIEEGKFKYELQIEDNKDDGGIRS
jgi:quinol monooxygenase YgiN